MAPEMIERKSFSGKEADIFSLGVLMFITTIGNFPFVEASKSDSLYNLLTQPNQNENYWK